jgi:hypothetical protein
MIYQGRWWRLSSTRDHFIQGPVAGEQASNRMEEPFHSARDDRLLGSRGALAPVTGP